MIEFIKRLFCKHHYELNRWHICHDPNGNDPAMIEAEWIYTKCGKVRYSDDTAGSYWAYSSICKEYERRIK